MSIALDANVLIYAADPGSRFHAPARTALDDLINSGQIVYAFWPALMAFLRIATHPSIFDSPLNVDAAIGAIDSLVAQPNVRTPGEGDRFFEALRGAASEVNIAGAHVPDAHLVALMREYGVTSILTHDRDFRKFDGVRMIDPVS